MKHLFIINSRAKQIAGHVDELEEHIKSFFSANPKDEYSIHKCRWKRDASGFTRRTINNAPEMIRVYALGGSGTLFEVINGIVGMPNAQVAWYPLGSNNSLLYTFGSNEKIALFQSLQNLCFSRVVTLDTIKAGNHYMITNALIGAEAEAGKMGESLAKRILFSRNFFYLAWEYLRPLLHARTQFYRFETENNSEEGEFYSILLTNVPSYGAGLQPASDAVFNDGFMDVYAIKPMPWKKSSMIISDYLKGSYAKWPEYISHYRCKKFHISSSTAMTISLDGELFYDTSLDFEICPASVNFVCPPGVTIPSVSTANTVAAAKAATVAAIADTEDLDAAFGLIPKVIEVKF
jgi:diacylglycerol kinase family enzyme